MHAPKKRATSSSCLCTKTCERPAIWSRQRKPGSMRARTRLSNRALQRVRQNFTARGEAESYDVLAPFVCESRSGADLVAAAKRSASTSMLCMCGCVGFVRSTQNTSDMSSPAPSVPRRRSNQKSATCWTSCQPVRRLRSNGRSNEAASRAFATSSSLTRRSTEVVCQSPAAQSLKRE